MIVQDHPEESAGAKSPSAHCLNRIHVRLMRRGWFWTVCLGLVLLAGNVLSNVPVAHASSLTHHNGAPASTQPPVVSGPRVSPNLNPQPLSVGAWHAQQAASASISTADTAPFAENPQGRKPGEQPDLRTATSDTYLNANGTWTLKSYGAPINYKGASGHWQPIDSTLVGDSSVAGYAYGNKADGWHVHFATQAGGPTLVHAQFPNLTMQETLQGAATVKGQANGSQMAYTGILPGTDLLYNVSSSNLEELLLLQNAQGPGSYTFVYRLPGASAHQDANGDVIFTDAKGNVLLTVGGVFMYESDAHGQMLPQGLGSQDVQVSLASKGADFTVTLIPSKSWLGDPKRHFPVAIDPSQNWTGGDSGQNTTNGNIIADTIDESGNPTTDYWNNVSLRIGNCNATQGTGTSRAYLKFPLGGAPAGVRVTSASLALYQTSMYSGGTGVQINANVVTSAWNATNLTWSNHPTGFIYGGQGSTASNQLTWINLNVTPAALEWWQGGVALNGIELQYANESQQCQFFESDNATSDRPSLTINYVQDTAVPTGSVTINGGVASTNNLNVTLQPSALDPGSNTEWNSNWSNINGISSNNGAHGEIPASTSVNGAGTELDGNTSSCGSSACWVQTYFTHTINGNNWPTFTAQFKTSNTNNFEVGIQDSSNSWTRCMLHGGSTGFVSTSYSATTGTLSSSGINIPISANTWYLGQFALVGPNVCAITIWPVGQTHPNTPSVMQWVSNIPNAGLVFQANGDNGSNLITYSVSSVTMTSNANNGTVGYGVSMMSLSSDGSTWGCPSYSGGSSFANGPWCVYSNQSFPFTLSGTDGKKTIWSRYVDNAGNMCSQTNQIIYDTTPPVVNSLTPGNDSEVRGIVTVQVNATDPAASDGSSSGVASAVLYVDGVQVGSPVSDTSKPTFLWDTTDLALGVHTLTAKATDAAGNTGVIGGSTIVIVDNTSGTSSAIIGSANVANGDAIVSAADLSIPGRGPALSLTRTYHALGASQLGFFGWGWTSELDEMLSFPGDGSVIYIDPSGGYHVFLPNGSGGYLTSPGLYLTLVKNSDGTYTITDRDQSKTNFSSTGQLGSLVDRHGQALTVNYGSNGLPSTVTDAAGRTLTITSSNGHITQIVDPGQRTYAYGYDGSGNLTDYTNPLGIDTHYTYDSSHHLLSVIRNYVSGQTPDVQTNVTTTLTYDSENRLIKFVDPMGYDTDLSYSTVGDASRTVMQRLQSISPATYASATFLMTADGMGAVAKATDALSNSTTFQYDANGNVTQATDPDGHVVTSTYDANGNVLTQTVDPGSSPHLNLTTTYTYDSANNILMKTDPADIVTQYTYDSPTAGDVTSKVENYVSGGATNSDTNVTTSSTYNSYGEVLAVINPMGVVTQYSYDPQGDVTQTQENYQAGKPLNADFQTNVTTIATYDVLGEKLTVTNPLGIVTQSTYDSLGQVVQTVANYQSGKPSDAQTNVTTKTSYDALGRAVTSTSPLGIVTKTVYDADGRVTETILNCVNNGPSDVQTNVISSTQQYDARGDALKVTDAKGNITTTTYDLDGRTLKTTQNDSSGTVLQNGQVVYDAAGLTVERDTLDASGNILLKQTYGFDSAGRSITTTAPPAIPGDQGQAGNSNVSIITYDVDGEQVEMKTTNAGLPSPGVVSDATATYDHLGRVLTRTEEANTSSSQMTSYIYDADGRQTSTTDPAGHTTSSTYGALGEALTTTQADGTVNTMAYDAAGDLLSTFNSAGTTKDTYDPLGRVTYEERDDGTGALQTGVTYTYDANGNKLQQQTNYPNGTSTNYTWTYDKLDRVVTMSDGTRTYTYDLNGNVTQMTVAVGGNNVTQDSYTYDGEDRLAGLTANVTTGNTTLHGYSYSYDLLGNQKQITEDGTTTTYSYDALNQLVDVRQGSTSIASYNYDANGNRTSMTTSAGTTSYSYDSSDTMLASKTDPDGKVTDYSYDPNGNLIQSAYDPTGSKHLTSFTYDAENRLTEVSEPGGMTIQYTYDADGDRISKMLTDGSTVTTIKDVYALGHLSEETDGSGNVLASFTYEDSGRPASVVLGDPSTGSRYYYVYNGHGDVVALVDASGNVVANYTYDAFGVITSSSENFPNNWSNPYRYDGADGVLYDGETGLYWMSVRAYDPTLGRFISHDPLGRLAAEGVDFAPYVYADNNPLIKTDPSGEFAVGSGSGGGASRSYSQEVRIAYQLALHIQQLRRTRRDKRRKNYATGFGYFTDKGGNVLGEMKVNLGIYVSNGEDHHSEKDMLNDFVYRGKESMEIFGQRFLWMFGTRAVFHLVIYSQRRVCDPCKRYINGFMKRWAWDYTIAFNLTGSIIGAPPVGTTLAYLDVFSSRRQTPYDEIFYPGTVRTLGDIKKEGTGGRIVRVR